jgi:molybdenum cofactor cytidylyltransferase
VGVQTLAAPVGSALFLLADQPFVTPDLIRALVQDHASSLAPITAPQVNGRRANPVLFDRALFPNLMQISGDTGGRALFQQYPPQLLPWPDERLLLDLDTPEDYETLQRISRAYGA